MHGRSDVVDVLLSRGSYQPDERDCCGTTPLMDALRAGFVNVAKMLIQQQHVRSFCHSPRRLLNGSEVVQIQNSVFFVRKFQIFLCIVWVVLCTALLLVAIMQYI